MILQNVICKIKLYLLPDSILDKREKIQFRIQENRKIRDHILLLSFLMFLIYPGYYFFYDPKNSDVAFWVIFRFGASFLSLISLIYYFKFKIIESSFYKLPLIFSGTYILFFQSYAAVLSTKLTTFSPFMVLMVVIYTAKMRPIYNFSYSILTFVFINYILTNGGLPYDIAISHSIVTLVVISLFSLRNYTSVRQFKLNIENNNFLKDTYNQLVHDVKSPLTALKFLSNRDRGKSSLLSQATNRVEKIILDLENKNTVFNSFNIIEKLNYLVSEVMIRYTYIDKIKIQININNELKSNIISLSGIDVACFSRIISNLFNNSVEANTSGHCLIKVSLSEREKYIDISILDNGPGIPIDNIQEVLKKNFTTKALGKGLGLSAAKEVVESSGGVLKVNSGNEFRIDISLVKNEADKV